MVPGSLRFSRVAIAAAIFVQTSVPMTLAGTKLNKGRMSSACAPHDASSMMIVVTDSKNDFPILTLNWWGKDSPSPRAGTYRISGSGQKIREEFQAAYCTSRGVCEQTAASEFELVWGPDSQEGRLKYSLTLKSGEVLTGNAIVEFYRAKRPVLCG
jgi:hypothetical protein